MLLPLLCSEAVAMAERDPAWQLCGGAGLCALWTPPLPHRLDLGGLGRYDLWSSALEEEGDLASVRYQVQRGSFME